MIRIREATKEDLDTVFNRSLVKDIPDSQRHMERASKASVIIYAGLVDEEPVCLYGLIPPTMLSTRAYLWLLTTGDIEHYKFLLVRHSQVIIEKFLEEYECLIGDTLVGDGRAMKWLRWLGAEFDYPVNGIAHFQITRERKKRWIQ